MKERKLLDVFNSYFKGVVDEEDFYCCKSYLEAIENINYHRSTKTYHIKEDEQRLLNFVKSFYKMKHNTDMKFKGVYEYLNTKKRDKSSLIEKMIIRNVIKKLTFLYPKFDEFIRIANQELNIEMEYIFYDLTNKEKSQT